MPRHLASLDPFPEHDLVSTLRASDLVFRFRILLEQDKAAIEANVFFHLVGSV